MNDEEFETKPRMNFSNETQEVKKSNNESQIKEEQVERSEMQNKILELEAKIVSLENEIKENQESFANELLRSKADLQNYTKRVENEKIEAIKFANQNILKAMTTPLDTLFLALAVDVNVNHTNPEELLKTLYQGVEITKNELLKTLANFGLNRTDPIGQKFDPNLHQAISKIVDETKDENTVTTVVQSGYELNGRVVKPALVIVSSKN
jgi:molecular chaperone GrpE